MKTLSNLSDIDDFIAQNRLAVLYISAPKCGVCTVMKPKINEIINDFDNVASGVVGIDEVPTLASSYHILTAPALLVFADGKEAWRGARFIDVADFENTLAQYTLHLD
ncbi:thioredoxin family protein [Moraxella oblonga]|uniref:thioredoxin family protein n=1 Tax=Moraxella oblonga TaxID=200413 RepID=UPI000834D2A2|nr:thioredoxin family protein [Moraxella oblonga]